MIKIQEHLNRNDADDFLDSLALKLWDYFNKKLANNSGYQHYSLIKRLERLILQTNEPGYLIQYANNDIEFFKRQKMFFEYLQADGNKKLKDLIISKPEQLDILRVEIFKILKPEDLFITNGNTRQTPFGALLVNQLFIYYNYRKLPICPELITEMNLQNAFCPYCNFTRIQVVDLSNEKNREVLNRAYLDIDHFYSKSKNPFFALSFFNLIPSCHQCNSTEKGDKDFFLNTHTNPFHNSYNDSHIFEIDNDYVIKVKTDNLSLIKIIQSDNFMDRDLHLSERCKHTYLALVNELIRNYHNYQHYRENPFFNHDYLNVLLQRVPILECEILQKEAGKMFRDVLMEIDVFDII